MSYYTESSSALNFRTYIGWLQSSLEIYVNVVAKHIGLSTSPLARTDGHQPAVQRFKEVIEGDPEMKILFDQVFLQVSKKDTVKDFDTLLHMLDNIVRSAPPYHVAKDSQGNPIGEPIGVPIYLIFDLLSNTSAGYDLFRLQKFNVALKDLLNAWGAYLEDPKQDSNRVLNTGEEGWFSEPAIKSLESNLGGLTFDETYYIPNPNVENRGYTTWDDFFTRTFQDGRRPVDFRENKSLIHSACESTVYRIAYNVNKHDQFWLKAQKYSLYDMLNGDNKEADYFNGGTVYQAFLNPLDYHRLHSPIDGVIEKIVEIPGTYYAVLPDEGAPFDDPDLPAGSPFGAMIRSQALLTVVATRVLVYIKADNPDIERLCFMGVGMVEVSTCKVTVAVGDRVETGDELGVFHFGGSTHTLIFRKDCNVKFAAEASVNNHVWVNSIIGQVVTEGAKHTNSIGEPTRH